MARSTVWAADHAGDVWPDYLDAARTLHVLVTDGHVNVVSMAWGQLTAHDEISDEITAHYYNDDVMFVGAAGTCPAGALCPNQHTVIYPASKLEVLAVSGAREDGSRGDDVYWGDKVGVIAFTNDATTGLDRPDLVALGGSSGSTGVVAGVAALVRARYPSMTNAAVMDRLISTSGYRCGAPAVWRDILVNAEAAVGGVCLIGRDFHSTDEVMFRNENPGPLSLTFSVEVSGGNGPLSIEWSNHTTGPSATYTFTNTGYDWDYEIWVRVRDTGSTNPGIVYTRIIHMYDRTCEDPYVDDCTVQ